VFGIAGVDDAEALDIKNGGQAGEGFDVAAVATGSVVVEDPRRLSEAAHNDEALALE
jgi:hypothetical protein